MVSGLAIWLLLIIVILSFIYGATKNIKDDDDHFPPTGGSPVIE